MRTAAVLLLLVACCASAVCARPALGDLPLDVVEALKVWGNGRVEMEDGLNAAFVDGSGFGGVKEGEEQFRVAFKFEVLPSVADDFEKEWNNLKSDLQKEKGLRRLAVSSDMLNNRLFYVYEEWDTMECFVTAMKKGTGCPKLGKFIKENDIGACLTQLLPVAVHLARSERGDAEESHPRILLKALIKPSLKDDFEDALQVLTEKIAETEEEGNLIFAWHKAAVDDLTYMGYAKWQDREALHKFLQSEHRKEFLAGVINHDVIIQKTYLKPIVEISNE